MKEGNAEETREGPEGGFWGTRGLPHPRTKGEEKESPKKPLEKNVRRGEEDRLRWVVGQGEEKKVNQWGKRNGNTP